GNEPVRLPSTNLFIERVEQLLAGGSACKRRSLVKCPAESAAVDRPFGRTVEWNPQPIEQVDHSRSPVAHFFDRRLMLKEIAAVNGVVEMQMLGIALAAGHIADAVDAALSTDRVRSFDRYHRNQVDRDSHLAELHGARQPRQPAADNNH